MGQFCVRCCLFFWVVFFITINTTDGQTFFLRDTFCNNQILIVNNHLYGPDNPTGTEILPGAAANGADSIIEVRLVFFKPAVELIDDVLCGDDTLWINQVPYHAGYTIGQEIIEGGASNGCDSIIQVQLTVGKEPVMEISDSLCPGAFITVNGTRYDQSKPSGIEVFSGATPLGCDSIVIVNLLITNHTFELGNDIEIDRGDTLCIEPVLNFQPASFSWSAPLPCQQLDCFPYCQAYSTDLQLAVTVTDSIGCAFNDVINIRVVDLPPVYAPTAFNPDADWPNNRFFLSAKPGIVQFKSFQIASRWGEMIFQKNNVMPDSPDEGWDGYWKGKIAPPGVYIFWTEAEWADGTVEVISGSFALLR